MTGSTGIILAALVDRAKQMKEEAAKMKDEEKMKQKKVSMKQIYVYLVLTICPRKPMKITMAANRFAMRQ
jgi:hypothetical protein